jgi:hypothetical protein
MWYTGGQNKIPWQTGYATSTNGLDWSIYDGNPVIASGGPTSWEASEADGPSVIKDGSDYKMWYYGCTLDYSSCNIGYATSLDGELWTKYPGNPVVTGTVGGGDVSISWPTVVKNGSTYLMWYLSSDGTNYTGIGLATSTDGIHWTKNTGNPILKTGWDNAPVGGISVVQDGAIQHQNASGRQIEFLSTGMHSYMALHGLHGDAAGGVVFVNCSVRLDRRQHDAEVRVLGDGFGVSTALPVVFLAKLTDLFREIKGESGSFRWRRGACSSTRRFGFRHG